MIINFIVLLDVGNATHQCCTVMHYRTIPNVLELNTLLGSKEVNLKVILIVSLYPYKAQAQILHFIQKFKWYHKHQSKLIA